MYDCEKGKYADFVVLDKDVLELEKTNKIEIFNTNVASIWFKCEKVYQAEMTEKYENHYAFTL